MFKGSRALSIFLGLFIIVSLYGLSGYLQLKYTNKLLSYVFNHLILIVIVLFQEEIRRTLADFGRRANFWTSRPKKTIHTIAEELSRAAAQMAKEKIGGLIVIEREDKLQTIMDTGTYINAEIGSELIYSIFTPSSPLHDGAIVVSNYKMATAASILPLSKDFSLDKTFGTRHRAALGLTEECDAIVILVSEERGDINLVKNGKITKNLSEEEIQQALIILLEVIDPKDWWKDLYFKVKNKIKGYKNEKK